MSPRRDARSSPRSARVIALLAALAATLPGCGLFSSERPEPALLSTLYQSPPGPPIRVDSTQKQHRVVLEAPSAGWRFSLDQVRKRFERFDVYVTITRPDPTFFFPQVVVEQVAGTGVDTTSAIRVYARVVEPKQPIAGKSEPQIELGPYAKVADAPAVAGPPAAPALGGADPAASSRKSSAPR